MFGFKKALICLSVSMALSCAVAAYANAEGSKTGVVKGDILNIRKSPSTSADVLEQLEKGMSVTVVSSKDGWYKISYKGITGWVSSEFVTVKQVSSQSATINEDRVNLRENASTDSLVLRTFNKGTSVSVLSSSGNWYKVRTSDGKVGWVFSDFINAKSTGSSTSSSTKSTSTKKTTSRGSEGQQRDNSDDGKEEVTSNATSDVRQNLVAYAKKFLGVRYVYGGSSPRGFDCSGFVSYVYNHFGISLERVAADQARQGAKVSRANLKPGDVVFYDTNGGRNYINHAGIYIGDGMFIHASSGSNAHKVVISSLSEGFYSNAYMSARRFLK
ncbi:C40 family peptidase [Pseudobacteroides cellulosolvens]|uniref:NLP/P60 protein n=1 Tax=Pseudobacteroides cellulosolvens ATCC 35603 = DSM 2933 TaxID=398512 RepID=A0A0L6JH87_9FIRM|nr:C40 family peptidase [Pseudobacteroides cellulosolvens]KNY25080.1 NLP/P60 protein [Pseudobacteroides cellulosolvens ATCC 35603 = DSM 2933]